MMWFWAPAYLLVADAWTEAIKGEVWSQREFAQGNNAPEEQNEFCC